jgi:hypothetical protein
VPVTDEIYVEKATTPRRAAEASLEELLTFERLLADLSARFANVSSDLLETEIENALKQLLDFLDFDRSNFGEFTADGWANILCSVAMDGVERYPPGPVPAFLSWYLGQLRADKIMRVRSLGDLPSEAIEQIEYRRRSGIYSLQSRNPAPCRRPHCRADQLVGVPLHARMAGRPHRAAKDRW